jgi:general secretion pathway protein G
MITRLRVLDQGFTLIELVVTVAIVGLLASMAMPLADVAKRRSQEQELHTALRVIREALDSYKKAGDEGHILRKAGESGYPPSLGVLVTGVEDAKDVDHRKLYFLRHIPRDPLFDAGSNAPPEKTWGLRSYASPPDKPSAGDDVFDIYSLTPGTGLNGIAYRDW